VHKVVEFISASTAGIVRVELGFEPDWCIFAQAHGATNPNIYLWFNSKYKGSGDTEGWPAGLSLLLTGSSGVVTRDTSGITVFAGGTKISSAETDNSSPKHIDVAGNPAGANHVTAAGVVIPTDHQTNSGRNVLVAFKEDSAYFASIQA